MYSVKDCNGDESVFEDIFDAASEIEKIIEITYKELNIEYDCYIDWEAPRGGVQIKGHERDRLCMYDRCLFSIWMDA